MLQADGSYDWTKAVVSTVWPFPNLTVKYPGSKGEGSRHVFISCMSRRLRHHSSQEAFPAPMRWKIGSRVEYCEQLGVCYPATVLQVLPESIRIEVKVSSNCPFGRMAGTFRTWLPSLTARLRLREDAAEPRHPMSSGGRAHATAEAVSAGGTEAAASASRARSFAATPSLSEHSAAFARYIATLRLRRDELCKRLQVVQEDPAEALGEEGDLSGWLGFMLKMTLQNFLATYGSGVELEPDFVEDEEEEENRGFPEESAKPSPWHLADGLPMLSPSASVLCAPERGSWDHPMSRGEKQMLLLELFEEAGAEVAEASSRRPLGRHGLAWDFPLAKEEKIQMLLLSRLCAAA